MSPHISGQILVVRRSTSAVIVCRAMIGAPGHQVTFEVFLCNHSPIKTTMKRIDVDGTRLTPAVLFHFHVIAAASGEAAFPVGLEMPRGIGKQITVRVPAMVGGLRMRQIPPIVVDSLAVHIVDAFEQKHPIRIRLGGALKGSN